MRTYYRAVELHPDSYTVQDVIRYYNQRIGIDDPHQDAYIFMPFALTEEQLRILHNGKEYYETFQHTDAHNQLSFCGSIIRSMRELRGERKMVVADVNPASIAQFICQQDARK